MSINGSLLRGLLFLILVSTLNSLTAIAQEFVESDNAASSRIEADIRLLASDSLIGRETGTPGEWMARNYIADKFLEIGLEPLFDTSYFESFVFSANNFVDMGTSVVLNKKNLLLYNNYYPLGFSANKSVSGKIVFAGNGIYCESQGVNDYKSIDDVRDKIVLLDLAVPDKLSKNNIIWDSAQKLIRVRRAEQMGAIGVIFFSSDESYGLPLKDPDVYGDLLGIPVVFIQNSNLINLKDPGFAEISVNIDRTRKRTGHNVGGYLNNNATNTVIIGAHYDHLGMGFFSTRDFGNTNIHNGADDNASGVAGVLELARKLVGSECKNNNYIFLAFSGEEYGLLGSARFLKNETYPKKKLNYMINLDMIGRLNKNKKIKIYGTGTSDVWQNIIEASEHFGLKIKTIKTGIGGSDHTSFNQKGVPAIFLHTGLHPDYHKENDDANLINFEGANTLVKFSFEIIKNLNDKGRINYHAATIVDKLMEK
jgi:aminopeptidase YwaD